jgi:RNA-binding protein 25
MPHGVGMPHIPIHQMPMYNPMMPQYPNQVPNVVPSKPVEIKKVWVSHIPPSLSDTFMLKLLETCGPVASWKRTTDQNGRPKGFGFCEFQTVEGMLKALRLLNHLKLEEGYELSVSKIILLKFINFIFFR